MKKLLFVLFAVLAATIVIGATVALTRSGEIEPEVGDEGTADETVTA
jgi:hypothetical protein